MNKPLNQISRHNLLKSMEDILDTRDKRYMFLRMEFKETLPQINIEGTPSQTAFNIYCEFEDRSMLPNLIHTLNFKFGLNLKLQFNPIF